MKELTDLELCKRIAEIEGAGKIHFLDVEYYEYPLYIDDDEDRRAYYRNPLVDDALCQQLIKKYSVSMIKDGDDWWSMIVDDVVLDWSLNFKFLNLDTDYNRAALLCIIEVHKC